MKLITLLFIVCSTSICHCQNFPKKEIDLERFIDDIFPVQDEDVNFEELYETLAQLLSNPLDLNAITEEQMRSLMIVSEKQLKSFFYYRANNGDLLSVYELQSVPDWDRLTFDKVIPFITVHAAESKLNSTVFRRIAQEENNYFVMRVERALESKKGYLSSTDSAQRYAGTPEKYYLRYRVSRSNDFSIGITAEKDPGEIMQWDPGKKYFGFDYVSAHAQLLNKGNFQNIILGDFQTQFGQGLLLGGTFGFGKNSETVTTVRRSNLGFIPYTSAGENSFFRGMAVSYSLTKHVTIHSFHSTTFRDGSIDSVSDSLSAISSFATSGLHRTPMEISRRQQIREQNTGAIFQFKNRILDGGIIVHQLNFSEPVFRKKFPYNQFAFSGNKNQNAGVFFNISLNNFTFFTEYGNSIGAGSGIIAGGLGNISSRLEIAILYRKFDRDFYSFYANPLSEGSTPQNEEGFYWGWKYRFSKKYSVSAYIDLFQFPWLRYRSYSPSEGNEWLIRFNYSPSKGVLLFLQYREESKTRNESMTTTLYQPSLSVKRNYWFNCDYQAPPYFTFKTRVQASTFEFNGKITRGVALMQDVNFSIQRWSLGLRYALFDTDDYDNRLYSYEKNVWLAYSFPAYDGIGVRNYVLMQYKFSKSIDLWARWSTTRYQNREQIGTGTETISSNSGNDVKFQLRIRF